ncbi:type I glyceraldehyde-3-phosphate dehydrogenase [Desulfuromonas carbonis]|uniref:type I glyceraldehyde-3-phosphate dehydrogenase n=1 Tax=Desulfuromonas sp. DDH964 TaxID=1823759 RepID=UPI00078D4152|nr:type I glyceraldehyde-3-phosphate dehydrogenase [Desulfuromonas sp. DDH964]AMV70542.1 glyceraldehyde-3-phosphate dehydrogenase, type I [Desulfuromonas sp. DDH964]
MSSDPSAATLPGEQLAAARVAINGFGRIGRTVLRLAQHSPAIEVVAINDLAPPRTLAHLFQYDSVHGPFAGSVDVEAGAMRIDGRTIRMLQIPDPAVLPWRELGIDIVIEATGRFARRAAAEKHLHAGARRVIISAPCADADLTVCLGVNEADCRPEQQILSNASCTANCLAPIAKVLLERFGIAKGMMNTVHPATNNQALSDQPHADPRRGRAAGLSIIPTTTSAIAAVEQVLPELAGRLQGMAVRVPTASVALLDLVVETRVATSVAEVNSVLRSAAQGRLKGIVEYCELPLVSRDFQGRCASAIVDGLCTTVTGGNLVRVIAWYDNETGYASRLVELAAYLARQESAPPVQVAV